jgi:hypothetical protein
MVFFVQSLDNLRDIVARSAEIYIIGPLALKAPGRFPKVYAICNDKGKTRGRFLRLDNIPGAVAKQPRFLKWRCADALQTKTSLLPLRLSQANRRQVL